MSLRPLRTLTLAFAACACTCACAGAVVPAASAAASPPIGAFTTKGAYSFVSAPKLHPPKVRVLSTAGARKLSPGFFMVANFPNLTATQPAHGKAKLMVGQSGPLILDRHLQPVWFAPVPKNVAAANLRTQRYKGKPVLTYWQGVVNPVGNPVNGEDIVVDQHYRRVATLKGKDGWILSLHEFTISGHDAWVTAYKYINMDLTPFGGSANGQLLDSAVQEYNLTNGDLLSTWDALEHIPPSQSEQPPAPASANGQVVPWDAYHVNSVQLVSGGKFLVSMRNEWAAYLVDAASGKIEWALGGKPFAGVQTFKFGRGASFQWQHDVELHRGNLLSVFDDACCLIKAGGFGPPSGSSRGLVLKLNLQTHTASKVAQYTHNPAIEAGFLGNTDLLPNGDVAVGWGSTSPAFFSEYSKTGKLLLDAQFPVPDLSYRAFVQKWVGKPFFAPSGAVRKRHGSSTVYASWDGATQLAGWRVLAGQNAKHLRVIVANKAKTGFETAIPIKGSFKAYKVQALDARGHVLRTSGLFPAHKSPASSFY